MSSRLQHELLVRDAGAASGDAASVIPAANPLSGPGSIYTLPVEDQNTALELHAIMLHIAAAKNPHQGCIAAAKLYAGRPGFSLQHLRRRFDAWTRADRDPLSLIDHRAHPAQPRLRLPAQFTDWAGGQLLGNQRKDAPAYRRILEQWQRWSKGHRDAAIPGYDTCPPPDHWGRHPIGWSYANLRKFARPPRAEVALARIGSAAASRLLPGVPGTRAGARFLEYITIDDVWLDRKIMVAGYGAPVRLLQMGCMDFASGLYLKFGQCPELPTDDGRRERLKELHAKYVIALLLEDYGYPLDYPMHLICERGTATVRPADAQALYDLTSGQVRICYTSMEGTLVLTWEERHTGNSRGKAWHESWHNLFHNESAHLPGQMGKDRDHCPLALHGMEREAAALETIRPHLPEPQRAALRSPFPDAHTAYWQTADIIDRINRRTEHDLEGFDWTLEWRLRDLQMDWQPEPKLAALPNQPDLESRLEWRRRKQSPLERAAALRNGYKFQPLHPGALIRFYEEAHVIVRVANGGVAFEHDGRKYAYLPSGPEASLPDGTELLAYYRPGDFESIHLTNKHGYLATWKRVQRIPRGDTKALSESIRNKHHWLNNAAANLRRRQADRIDAEDARITANQSIIESARILPVPAAAADPQPRCQPPAPAQQPDSTHDLISRRAAKLTPADY